MICFYGAVQLTSFSLGESFMLLLVPFDNTGAAMLSLSVFVVRWGVGSFCPAVTSVDPMLLWELDRGANVSFLWTCFRLNVGKPESQFAAWSVG